MKPIPVSMIDCATCAGLSMMFAPRASSTSALPDFLDTERLPCLATAAPPPATTNATAVETLGLSREHRVILYDRRDSMWEARLWWMLRGSPLRAADFLGALAGAFGSVILASPVFTWGERVLAVVTAITALARSLNLSVVAEGVEHDVEIGREVVPLPTVPRRLRHHPRRPARCDDPRCAH